MEWLARKRWVSEIGGEMVGYVWAQMSLAVIRSNTLLLCGVKIVTTFIPEILDGATFSAMEGILEW